MRIVEIGRLCAKLRTFEKCEKRPKMSDFSQIYVILKILVTFRTFQVHVTLHRINQFQRFSSQIIPPFFYFNCFSGIFVGLFNSLLKNSKATARVGTFLRCRPSWHHFTRSPEWVPYSAQPAI